jgi:hypothetical protein
VIAIMAPVVVPKKLPICRGKAAGFEVRAPWGSNGLVCPFSQTLEVLPQRGHDPPTATPCSRQPGEARLLGSMIGLAAPIAAPPETSGLQRNGGMGRGSMPFGGSDGLVCFLSRKEVLPQRGHGPTPRLRPSRSRLGPAAGVHDHHRGPHCGTPRNPRFAGEIAYGAGVHALWGPPSALLLSGSRAKVLPQRGHGPSPLSPRASL